MAPLANKRLDPLTTLVGWINSTATDPLERTRLSNEVVRISTPLDAAEQITLVTSHPGAGSPITVVLAGTDGANSKVPCLFFARANVSPMTPPGCHVSLTH